MCSSCVYPPVWLSVRWCHAPAASARSDCRSPPRSWAVLFLATRPSAFIGRYHPTQLNDSLSVMQINPISDLAQPTQQVRLESDPHRPSQSSVSATPGVSRGPSHDLFPGDLCLETRRCWDASPRSGEGRGSWLMGCRVGAQRNQEGLCSLLLLRAPPSNSPAAPVGVPRPLCVSTWWWFPPRA